MRSKLGITLLIIGGILMIVSSAIGSIGVYEFLRDYINGQINIAWIKIVLDVCVEILRWIANFGGATVIVGAIFIAFNQYRFGKWLISVGLTFGTLALVIWVISTIVDLTGFITDPQILAYLDQLSGFFTYNTGLQFIGVATAIIGKNLAKRPKKPKEEKIEEVEITAEEKETESPLPFQNIYCPNCGSSLPFNAEFCSQCGHSLER
ncbi:MAG: zinc ribbon domain-containing protein [Candidatus Odinarchaeota archaeon]